MAHAMGTSRVIIPALPGLSQDAGADVENKGVVCFTSVDVTSYPTNGETLTAAELGLSKLFTLHLQEGEGELHRFSNAIQAGGASVIVTALVASTGTEAANTTDLGVIHVIASGEGATAGVVN
jgi:hypothetical protein